MTINRLIAILFMASGAAALAYEIVWAGLLAAQMGHTALVQAMLLGTFLAGLALGAELLGKWTDAWARPIRAFALCEAGIGLAGALSPLLLAFLGPLQASLTVGLDAHAPAVLASRLLVAIATILPPAILMGGSFPLLVRAYQTGQSVHQLEHPVATMYLANMMGGVLGCLGAGLWLIPLVGFTQTAWLAATLNLLIALGALSLDRYLLPAEQASVPHSQGTVSFWLAACAVLTGIATLWYEIAWTRLLALVLGSSSISFTLMVAAFLVGLSLGSLWVLHHLKASSDRHLWLALSQGGAVLAAIATLPLYTYAAYGFAVAFASLPRTEVGYALYEGLKLLVCGVLTLPVATCLGMALPLLVGLGAEAGTSAGPGSGPATPAAAGLPQAPEPQTGRLVGRTYALNTAGNLLGAATGGLVLLPRVGLFGLIELGAALNLAIALWALSRTRHLATSWRLAWSASLPVLLALSHAASEGADPRVLHSGADQRDDLAGFASYIQAQTDPTLLFHLDGPDTTLDVEQHDGDLRLLVNGKVDATAIADLPTQLLLGHLPLFLRPDTKDALLIGMGSGMTAGAMLTHPQVVRLDVVDLNPAAFEAARIFDSANHRVAINPRLHPHQDDGLAYMRHAPGHYDLIVNQPSNPWIAGVCNLFSTAFYQAAQNHLTPNGLLVQWLQGYDMDDASLALALDTLRQTFPHVTLWQGLEADLIVVASMSPQKPLVAARLDQVLAQPTVKSDLARMGIHHAVALLATQRHGPLAPFSGDTPVNTLDHPRLGYLAPRAHFYRASPRELGAPDQRLDWRRQPPPALLAAQYLSEQRRSLTAPEYQDIAHVWLQHSLLFAPAEALLTAWVEREPQGREARLELARARWQMHRRSEATRLLDDLAIAFPKDETLIYLGIDWEMAVLRSRPSRFEATRSLARLKRRLTALVAQHPDLRGWTADIEAEAQSLKP